MRFRLLIRGIAPLLLTTGALVAQPLINPNGIVNSASFAPALSPGGALAQGSIFSIFGSQLGPATGAQPTAFPLATALGGASVKIIQGTNSVDALPLYSSAGLINAIMPSNAPTGKVSVQVTYNGAKSNMAPVRVTANAPGIYTATGAGLGPGILQNFAASGAVPVNSPSTTATPGQVMILWLTGLGPIKAADNVAPPVGTLPFPVEIWVGGKAVTNIAYAGRTPCCAGVDQVVFTMPAGAPTGCYVPVTMRVAGAAVSNTVTIAIDAQGAACSDAANPISGPLTKGGKVGVVVLKREALHSDTGTITDLTVDRALAAFRTPAPSAFTFNSAVAVPPPGSCTVYSGTGDYTSGTNQYSLPNSVLDAGALTLTGPAGAQTFTSAAISGLTLYSTPQGLASSPAGVVSGPALYLNAGSYRISAAGGADVGPFTASITMPASGVTWTNRDQILTIDRTQPLTLNWSGSASAVSVGGVSYDAASNSSTKFQCLAPPGATSFTVPPWILANLTPAAASSPGSRALLGLISLSAPATFSAPGLDSGIALALLAQQKSVGVR